MGAGPGDGVPAAQDAARIRCGRHAWELVAAHAGQMMVRTKRILRLFRIFFPSRACIRFTVTVTVTGSIVFFLLVPARFGLIVS